MPITVNQDMIHYFGGDDTTGEGPITVSANVYPGNLIQEVKEALGWKFDPDTTPLPDYDVAILKTVIIELWDDLIVESIDYVDGDEDADVTVNRVTNLPANTGGITYHTLHDELLPDDADVYLVNADIVVNTNTWKAALHEFGHALGLVHPGDYNATDDVLPTWAADRMFDQDTARYSIMSYFNAGDDGSQAGWDKGATLTPMIYDILAVQHLYGVDTTTRTNDTTYGFHGDADRAIFNFSIDPAVFSRVVPVMTIWDAGGTDTLDFSLYSVDQRIDLSPGSYSDIGTGIDGIRLFGNFGIAFGTWIENAIGGTGDDNITGNELNNRLDGGSDTGDDTLIGLDGQDTLIGRAGDDTLDGGNGDDVLEGGDGADSLRGGQGGDTLSGGIGDDSLFGGRDVDTLDGGADNDFIDGGGSGSGGPGIALPDVLTGGTGSDTFIYQRAYKATVITDFNIRDGEADVIDMRSEFANVFSFTDLLARAQQIGNDVVFNFGASDPQAQFDKLTLKNQTIGALDPGMFRFSEDPSSPPSFFGIIADPDPFRPVFTDTAALLDGGFVTATTTIRTYYDQTIFGNRFDYRGALVSSFAINTTPLNFGNTANQTPFVTSLTDGRIVAVWESEDTGLDVIRARLFSADMVPLGDDFIVNGSPITGDSSYYATISAVNARPGGGFAVIWQMDADARPNFLTNVVMERAFDGLGNPTTNDLFVADTLDVPHIQLGPGVGISLDDDTSLYFQQIHRSLNAPPYIAPGPLTAHITGEEAVLIADQGIYANGTVVQLADGRIQFVWQGTNGGSTGTFTAILDSDLHGFTKPGTNGSDTLKGGIYNDQLYGLGGSDTLIGGRGPDILDGGAGIDTADYDASLEGVHIDMSDGAPESDGHANGDVLINIEAIRGSGYADTIIGDFHDNRLDGSFGDDTIDGGLGNDTVIGGRGNDTLDGGGGMDIVYGGDGNDAITLRGDESASAFGGDGNDTFMLMGSHSLVYGQAGKDTFKVTGDYNTVYVGPGDDTNDEATISGSYNAITGNDGNNVFRIDGGSGNSIGGGGGDDTLTIEGDGDGNQASGGDGKDTIQGGGGNDIISTDLAPWLGASFDDAVNAGAGDDVVFSTGNHDTLDGGADTDALILNLSWITDPVAVTFGPVETMVTIAADGTRIVGFENISLTLGEDGDTVIGSGGPDGDFEGSLTLFGQGGADTLVGGDGADFLSGGASDDTLTGGDGADTFVYSPGDGVDTITDFEVGFDKIDLTALQGSYHASDLNIRQDGNDTVITLGSGFILRNVQMGMLSDRDFVFQPDPNTIPGIAPTKSVAIDEDTGSGEIVIDPNFNEGSTLTFALLQDFGPYIGTVDLAAGHFVYTPFANAFGFDTFTILVDNGQGGTAQQVVSVNVAPVNDVAVIGGTVTGAVTEDSVLTIAGALSVIDPDANEAGFQPNTVAGDYGSLKVTESGAWTYVLDNAKSSVQALNAGQSVSDLVKVTSIDGTQQTITITVKGANESTSGQVEGTDLPNTMNGTNGDDVIDAKGGDDVVFGGKGNDTLKGGAGNDLLSGGAGNDRLEGGIGSDTADYQDYTAGVTVSLMVDGPQDTGGAGIDTLVEIENLRGSRSDDTLSGDNESNRLQGGMGNDVLYGLGGDDFLFGDSGSDTLYGGAGRDTLAGGLGVDTFVIESADSDIIKDWTAGEKIDISGIDFAHFYLSEKYGKTTVTFDTDGDDLVDGGSFLVLGVGLSASDFIT